MKRIIIALISCGVCVYAGAFTTREHATVAYIAEQHLTPAAKNAVREIFHGDSMVDYASWPDLFRKVMLDKNGKEIPHMLRVDKDFYPAVVEPHKSAYYAITEAQKRLKNYKHMSDSARIADLSIIVHLLGDIHCPSHLQYADSRHKQIKTLYYKSGKHDPKKVNYHYFWDEWAADQILCGGFLEQGYLLDTYSETEISDIQKGSLEDWIYDSAYSCKDIFDVENEAEINKRYVVGKVAIVKSQVRKAGYRLAKMLNGMFK